MKEVVMKKSPLSPPYFRSNQTYPITLLRAMFFKAYASTRLSGPL